MTERIIDEARERELSQKKMRIEHFLQVNNLAALILGRQNNFAWATAGGSNWVSISEETGVAALIFKSGGQALAVLDNLEAPRFEAEEHLTALGFEIVPRNWWLSPSDKVADLVKIAGSGNLGADYDLPGSTNVEGLLATERLSLTPDECDRYRKVCGLAAAALETVAMGLQPGLSEWEIVARMAEASYNRQLIPFVTLVATDERVFNVRHPIPTTKKLEKYAMLVLCTKAGGLISNLTRLVHFGKLPDELAAKHHAVQTIDATFNLNTRIGAKVSNIFEQGLKAYAKAGYPDEWQLHHQGGGTGYKGRDFHGRPDAPQIVLPNQAFAWNPSIAGTKSEDTILITEEGDLELLTTYPGSSWKNTEITLKGLGSMHRPNILEL